MRRLPIALLAATLLAVPAADALASHGPTAEVDVDLRPRPYPSIHIQGDAGLRSSELVDRGEGSADDPFVIEDLLIRPTRYFGLLLEGTSDHVVFRNVTVLGQAAGEFASADCYHPSHEGCRGTRGIYVDEASNATFEQIRIHDALVRMNVADAEGIRIDGALLGSPQAPSSGGLADNVGVLRSTDVSLSNLTTYGADRSLAIQSSSHVHVRDSTFHESRKIAIQGHDGDSVDNVTFERVLIEGTKTQVNEGPAENLTFAGVTFRAAGRAETLVGVDPPLADVDVCGSRFTGQAGWPTAVSLGPVEGTLRFEHNVLDGNEGGVAFGSDDVQVHGNRFLNTSPDHAALYVGGPGAEIHQNSFEGNDWAAFLSTDGIDASHNWWNHSSGPRGDGPGEGEFVTITADNVTVTPPLEEPPPFEPECGVPLDTVGAEQVPDETVGFEGDSELSTAIPAETDHRVEATAEVGPMEPLGREDLVARASADFDSKSELLSRG